MGAAWRREREEGTEIEAKDGRQHRALTAGGLLAAIILTSSACEGPDRDTQQDPAPPNTIVAELSPGSPTVLQPAAVIPTATGPVAIASGAGSIWVAHEDGSVARIDPRADEVRALIDVGRRLGSIAYGHGAVWAGDMAGFLYRIDPRTNRVSVVRRFGQEPVLAVGAGALWVAHGSELLSKVDPDTGKLLGEVKLDQPAGAPPLSSGGPVIWRGSVWVPHAFNKVSRIDSRSLQVVEEIEVGYGPRLVRDGGRLWVATFDPAAPRGAVSEVSLDPTDTMVVAEGPWNVRHIVASRNGFWIRPDVGVLLQLLPEEGTVNNFRFRDREYPGGLHHAFGSIWAANSTVNTIWRIRP